MKNVFILLILLTFFSSNIYAATGCRVTTGMFPGVYHTVASGTNYTCNYYGTLAQCQAGQSSSNSWADVTSSSPGTACRACFSNGAYQYSGTIVTYNRLFCPLDDYIPWLILPVGIFGFFCLRRRNLLV